MQSSELFLLVTTGLCFYCTGASWMLQIVCYPTYQLVGDAEFVPFHVSFGRRLGIAAVAPMVITALMTFVLVFFRPEDAPLWAALVVAACSAIILGTTATLEVPRHMKLDREGKSEQVIKELVSNNIPRVASWTVASLTLLWMLTQVFG